MSKKHELAIARLRQWASNIEEYGPDMRQWSNPRLVCQRLREIASLFEEILAEK